MKEYKNFLKLKGLEVGDKFIIQDKEELGFFFVQNNYIIEEHHKTDIEWLRDKTLVVVEKNPDRLQICLR